MDKKRVTIWVVVVALLIVLLYVFARPTGNVISEGSSGILNATNESEGNESEVDLGLSPGEISACGDLNETGTYTLTADVSSENSTCFVVNAADIIIDCNDNSVTGGISANANTTVLDCSYDSLSVGEGVSVDVKESMSVSVVNQKNISVQSVNVAVDYTADNVTTSLGSGVTNENGVAIVNVVRSSHVGDVTSEYGAFDVSATLDGFNGSVSSLENVTDLNVEIEDITAPVVVVETPSSVSSNDVRFSFEVTETGGLENCTAYVREGTSVRNTAFVEDPDDDNSVNIDGLDDETIYQASAECFDKAGLLGTSGNVEFTTDEDSSSSSGSGSGSESSSGSGSGSESGSTSSSSTPSTSGNTVEFNMTYQVSDDQFSSGYSRKLFVDEGVSFVVNNDGIYLQLIEIAGSSVKVTDGSAVVEISSEEAGRFDTDSDGIYDVMVILGDLEIDSAALTFLSINEAVPEGAEEIIAENDETSENTAGEGSGITGLVADENADGSSNKGLAVIVIIILAALGFIIYRWVKLKKGKSMKNDSKRGEVNLSDEDDFDYTESNEGNSSTSGDEKKGFFANLISKFK